MNGDVEVAEYVVDLRRLGPGQQFDPVPLQFVLLVRRAQKHQDNHQLERTS